MSIYCKQLSPAEQAVVRRLEPGDRLFDCPVCGIYVVPSGSPFDTKCFRCKTACPEVFLRRDNQAA